MVVPLEIRAELFWLIIKYNQMFFLFDTNLFRVNCMYHRSVPSAFGLLNQIAKVVPVIMNNSLLCIL